MSSNGIGLDFGTTNSVASTVLGSGELKTASYSRHDGSEHTFPSLLTFWQEDHPNGRTVNRVEGGHWAIDAFQENAPDCRFVKSIKTFAANPHFSSTTIFGHRYEFADFLRVFLKSMRDHGDPAVDWDSPEIVVGRPIRFAGPNADDELALRRYRAALASLGFVNVRFVYEPLAAAYYYVRQLQGDATIFVADLGGGTSDFSVLRVKRRDGALALEPLASRGLDLAGDQFDYRIIQNTVAPSLGKGSKYRSFDKELEIPASYYARLSRWNEVSMLRGSATYRDLVSLRKRSLAPERIERFIRFIESEMLYELYENVSKVKRELSTQDSAHFRLGFEGGEIEADITRGEFNRWIEGDLAKLDRLVDDTLGEAGLQSGDIDTVFLTGGTSFVPAVRELFEHRFGRSRIESGNQLISIANGLALIARDDDDSWLAA